MGIIRWITALLVIAVLLVVVLLAIDNGNEVTFKFFWLADWTAPLVVMLYASFAVGILLGLAAGTVRILSLKRQVRKQQKKIGTLEQQTDLQKNDSDSNLTEDLSDSGTIPTSDAETVTEEGMTRPEEIVSPSEPTAVRN